jgi:DNA primase
MSPINVAKVLQREECNKIYKLAENFYHENLMSDSYAQNYLAKRKITLDTTIRYRLGYSNENKYSLWYKLRRHKFNLNSLKNSKIHIINKDNKPEPIFFGSRIIFPIKKDYKTVSFSSRATSNKNTMPHIHARGNLGIFYNHDLINKSYDSIFITEGVFDCLSLLQLGYPAIALLRCRYNRSNNYFFKNTKEIIIILDNDSNKSGQNGSVKMAKDLFTDEELNSTIKIAVLPPQTDCNQLLVENKAYEIRKSIEQAFEFTMDKSEAEKYRSKKFGISNKNTCKNRGDNLNLEEIIKKKLGEPERESFDKMFYRCPFHEDTEPSLVVYKETNSFYCFGCGLSGGPNRFLYLLRKGIKQ